VALLLVAAPLAASPLPAALFGAAEPTVVPPETLRVTTPWSGTLFDLLAAAAAAPEQPVAPPEPDAPSARDAPCGPDAPPEPDARPAPGAPPTLGLVVPMRWLSAEPAPDLIIVADHVNARLAGPLTGRRPASGPYGRGSQPFPSMSGLYQPETIRRSVGRRVYSVVAVAGVARVGELSPFERRAIAATGCPAACDCLVDAAVVAALHGFKVAACGVPL